LSSQQLPNEDLKRGDRIMITEWVKERAFVKQRNAHGVLVAEFVHEDKAGDDDTLKVSPNRQYVGDVLEVLGMDYPLAIFDVHTVQGAGDYTRARVMLDVRDFNCKQVGTDYVAAVMSGIVVPPPPVPLPTPSPQLTVVRLVLPGLEQMPLRLSVLVVIVAFAYRWATTGAFL